MATSICISSSLLNAFVHWVERFPDIGRNCVDCLVRVPLAGSHLDGVTPEMRCPHSGQEELVTPNDMYTRLLSDAGNLVLLTNHFEDCTEVKNILSV